jgi:hypothetical protein
MLDGDYTFICIPELFNNHSFSDIKTSLVKNLEISHKINMSHILVMTRVNLFGSTSRFCIAEQRF